jgi:hypothetical protein
MRLLWCLLSPTLLFALGCGNARYVPVSGTVTLNGEPLADAYITFQPVSGPGNPYPGPGSYAKTDAEGRFALRVVGDDVPGAVAGMHAVSISAYRGEKPEPTAERVAGVPNIVPERYNAETDLRFGVPPGGTQTANFPLTSP